MQSSTALQTIQTILSQIEADLSHITDNLQTEFTNLNPPQTPSPISLLTTLHTLQKSLPPLREALLQIYDQKSQLASTCRSDLSQLHQTAVSLLPIAAPTLASDKATPARDVLQRQLASVLHESDDRLEAILRSFLRAHARLTSEFPSAFPALRGKDLDAALLRAAALAPDPKRALQDIDTNSASEASSGSSHAAPLEVEKTPVKEQQKQSVQPKAAPREEADIKSQAEKRASEEEAFVPVEKAVYNRLPRNLKIRAGKLADINAFYQKVWRVLREADGAVPDKHLLQALGEDDLTKVEVLRGLAVVRHGRDGWQLAGNSKVSGNARERIRRGKK